MYLSTSFISYEIFIWVQASKAAQISFFETLRTEFGSDIGITIVTPGFIESEMTTGDTMTKVTQNTLHQETFYYYYFLLAITFFLVLESNSCMLAYKNQNTGYHFRLATEARLKDLHAYILTIKKETSLHAY